MLGSLKKTRQGKGRQKVREMETSILPRIDKDRQQKTDVISVRIYTEYPTRRHEHRATEGAVGREEDRAVAICQGLCIKADNTVSALKVRRSVL